MTRRSLRNSFLNRNFESRIAKRPVPYGRGSVRFLISLSFAFILFTGFVWAQSVTATIRGRLLESSGAVLPSGSISAINEETNETHRTRSSPEGDFAIPMLSPGSYRVEAEVTGFRKYVAKGIQVQIGQNLRMDVALAPGGPTEEITVTADQKMIEPDSTHTGYVIDNRAIVSYPLDGRNFLELTLLLPGTAPSAQGSPGSVRGEFSVNASGGREDSNNFILDGAFNNDPKLNTFAINPPVDAIREFEVLTGSYDAGYGRSAGAQVNMALKSGTNAFHGTAYEFFRNAALDARNFFARAEDGAPRDQRNQFGFSLGGPLKKDHTFFFSDYEGRRMNEGITQTANVPTQMERIGDFSQNLLPRPVDPFTQTPFADGRIPPERINAIGKAIAALYPLPNRSVPGQNYISSPVLRDRDDRFDVRLDHTINQKYSFLARYSFSDRYLYEPFSGTGFASVPGFGTDTPRRAQNLLAGGDQTLSSRFINQIRLAFNRVAAGVFQEERSGSLNRAVGLPELSSNSRDFGLSFITVSGFSPLGDEYNNPQHSAVNVYQVEDTLTYSRGKHLIRTGFDFRALQQNAFRDVQSRGLLAFSDYGQVTGNGLADMLLGFVTYSGGAQLDNPQHLRTRSIDLFVQDSYRVYRNVTLQLGVRYEYNSPGIDEYDRANTYDPVSKTLVSVGQENVPRGVYDPDKNNWGPRIGIAWSPGSGNETVLHAGYGIYYDQSSLAPGEGLYFNKPYYDFKLYYPLPGFPLTINNPFPAAYPLTVPGSALGFDRHLRTPYFQQWNLTFERQIGRDIAASIGYVGSKGTRILSARDINQPGPSPVSPNPRPVPQFADIIYLESRGNSSYNSLQARLQKRFGAGTSALVSYTFGKSLDNNSTFFSSSGDANFPQNSSDPGAEKGRSNFDIRHRFSLGFSWDLPLGQGRQFLSGRGLLSSLLSGWAACGIVTVQSGAPFTIALLPVIDNSNTGIETLGFGANNRPNRTAFGKLQNPGADRWFDTSAFTFAPYGSFGNSGRNILDGPGYRDFSVSLAKDTRFGEALDLQFRTEFFNALNETNFNLPDNFLGSPSFGRIASARNPRRIQFGLKLIF
jgi:hypothetical protein